MKALKDGGPAFPVTIQQGSTKGLPGLTLRDYFAAAALTGLLADPNSTCTVEDFAEGAYECADAMLVQRRLTKKDQS
jgi:hypothetical protein